MAIVIQKKSSHSSIGGCSSSGSGSGGSSGIGSSSISGSGVCYRRQAGGISAAKDCHHPY